MRDKEVFIVTEDVKYILPILGKLVETYDQTCSFTLIYDIDSLDKVLSDSKYTDVLIIDDSVFAKTKIKQNFTNILVLTQGEKNDFEGKTERLNIQYVNKYRSLKEIVNEISSCSVLRGIIEDQGVTTKVIVVYSPIGGSGTTTMAMGLSAVLTQKHKKVLYQNIGQLQNFAYRFSVRDPMKEFVVKIFKETDNDFYENIKVNFREEVFTYIPPFPRCLSSLDIHDRHIVQSITKIKETGIYDYIVIDTPSGMNDCTSELMALAESILLVGKNDPESKFKFDIFLNSIDCSDTSRFTCVINHSDVTEGTLEDDFHTEHVGFHPEIANCKIEELCSFNEIERMGIMFI